MLRIEWRGSHWLLAAYKNHKCIMALGFDNVTHGLHGDILDLRYGHAYVASVYGKDIENIEELFQ